MVVTAQHLATEVGVDVLKKGGNAVDAAVAVGYALAVVYPAAGNLGGGGFMTIQLADGRKTFLDFREKAPLAATPNMYLDAAGNVIKGLTTTGHLAVGVPGTVSGLEMALAKYGTMRRADADRAGDPLRRAGLRARPGRRRHAARPRPRRSRPTRRRRRSSSSNGAALRGRRPARAARPRRRRCAQIRDGGAAGFYKGPVGARDRRVEPGRQGHHHAGRPRPVPDPRAGAGRVRLPRLPHRLGAAAELGRRRSSARS